MNKKIILLMGPTASGKTDLAIKIAQSGNYEIINGDAMQIYQEIPIITAQPTIEEKSSIAHHLFGYKLGDEACSVANWLVDAQSKIEEVLSRNNIPIIVGGSGLYFKALTDGISNIPTIDLAIREETRNLFDLIGRDAFYQELLILDPSIAEKIKSGDSQRMIRAFEVMKQTGRSISDWQQQTKSFSPFQFLQIQLDIPRPVLHAKINKRFILMAEGGAIDEARYIMNKYDGQKLSINKAHGIPELINYLKGVCTLEQAIERAQIITRQYAKRQVTWLRNQTNHLMKTRYIGHTDFKAVASDVDKFIDRS